MGLHSGLNNRQAIVVCHRSSSIVQDRIGVKSRSGKQPPTINLSPAQERQEPKNRVSYQRQESAKSYDGHNEAEVCSGYYFHSCAVSTYGYVHTLLAQITFIVRHI